MLDRQDIRLATIAALTGKTAAGDRVYPTPILPWRRDWPLPAIGVYTTEEAGEGIDGGIVGAFQFRYSLRLQIECVVATPGDAQLDPVSRLMVDSQADLDALLEDVTTNLLCNPDWYRKLDPTSPSGWCMRFEGVERWDTTCSLARVEDSDVRTMSGQIAATLTYERHYDPVEVLDDLCRVDLDVDVIDPAADPNVQYPGPDGRIEVALVIPPTPTGAPSDPRTLCD